MTAASDTYPAQQKAPMPKAELHVHLEGTLEPALMLEFARRNNVDIPWADEIALRGAYDFAGLEQFLAVYFAGCRVLRTRRDFYELTLAYLEKAAQQGVLRAEMHFGPQSFLDNDIRLGDQLGGIFDAIDDAASAWGIDGSLLISAHRHRSQSDAIELFDLVQPWASRIGGFGLGSAERGNPPSKFEQYFAAARTAGFRTTIHAGEEGPAAYVREALDVCQVDRIDHGVASVEDPDLVQRLADTGTPLTMCPLSNLRLHVVDDLAAHPLVRLRDAGVVVTVNSDDPSYFGGYIDENYAAVSAALNLGPADRVELAQNSFTATFAGDEQKHSWLTALHQWSTQQT